MLGEHYRVLSLDQADRLHLLQDGDVVLILGRPLLVARNKVMDVLRARKYWSGHHPNRTLTAAVRLLLQKYIEVEVFRMREALDALPPHPGAIAVGQNAGI